MLYGAYKVVEGILAVIGIFILIALLATPLAGIIVIVIVASILGSMFNTPKKRGSYYDNVQKGCYEDKYYNKLNSLYEEEAARRKSEWQNRR